ncbi:MAG: hypothetical protein ACXACY_26125 [Candidatus Hodarchaeales archaeon]|jgi:hypothetical protein
MGGLIKMKGDIACISPERFVQHPVRIFQPWHLLKQEIMGWCIFEDKYWVIVKEAEGHYGRYPFARNWEWFRALTSEPEFAHIRKSPQIYITGTA